MSDAKNYYYRTVGKVAILIDGAFFLKRMNHLCRPEDRGNVDYIEKMIRILCVKHAKKLNQQIYRIFFYDCAPYDGAIHHPLTNRFINFKKTEHYQFKTALFEKLRTMRKMALRLGRLNIDTTCRWQIKSEKVKELLKHSISVEQLDPEKDILPALRQKQVDMKIGIDIASMVLKHQVESIVLIAGDGDFVPASKLARREGIDFILDPMWAHINPDLNEHVDGVNTVLFQRRVRPVLTGGISGKDS